MSKVPPQRSPGQRLRRKAPDTVMNESTAAAQRLVDYFLVVTPEPTWNRKVAAPTAVRVDTGNIQLPQQRKDYTFSPSITARYPEKDYEDNPLNPMVIQFCFPSDDVVYPSRSYVMPRVHHFVLTNERGRRVYGTCLTVFEEYKPDGPWKNQSTATAGKDGIELSDDKSGRCLYIPKVLCVLSNWPYLTAFREYLAQLYRLATATNVMKIPIERYVVNLCQEIPAPPPGAYEVQLSILDSTIRFWAPPAKLPIAYVSLPFQILFQCLDVPNVLTLWKALALERKVLLVSTQHSILTVCAEILISLLFPLRWSHLYVPMLPRLFSPMLDAPVPYLCGIVRENWMYAQEHISGDCIVVDLDRNEVKFGHSTPEMPDPPANKYQKLESLLNDLIGSHFWKIRGLENLYSQPKRSDQQLRQEALSSTSWKERLSALDYAYNLAYTPDSPNWLTDRLPESEQTKWAQVQEAFHQFFVACFKDYRKFLDPGNDENQRPSFDRNAFLNARKAANTPFLSEMCKTQQFDDFLTRKMYSPGEPDLVFFDQSIDAKKNRSKLKLRKKSTPFLQSASAHKDLTKLPAVAPNDKGLHSHRKFVYKKWPDKFNKKLINYPRPIPKMITVEFDRQASAVGHLRRQATKDTTEAQFFGGDYEPSADVGAFTVHFFVYSSLVGKRWQRYLQTRLAEDEKLRQKNRTAKREVSEEEKEHSGCEGPSDTCDDLGLCSSCSGESFVGGITSALASFGRGAEGSYQTVFETTVENMQTIKETLNFQAERTADTEMAEFRALADAQLNLAFENLATARLRKLPIDSDAYLSLMEACGRCGDTKRAVELIHHMRKDGLASEGEVLSSFLAAFSLSSTMRHHRKTRSGTDAQCQLLQHQFKGVHLADEPSTADNTSEGGENASQSTGASSGTSKSYLTGGSSVFEWFNSKGKKKRRYKYKKKDLPVTDMVARQINLAENVLDYVYPGLEIDTNSDSCPHCSQVMTEHDVVAGWSPCNFSDHQTTCPKCKHDFVSQFKVSCPSEKFIGSQGPATPLHCEFLSPWVLRKELQTFVKGRNSDIDDVLKPEWREGNGLSTTLFWNILVLFRRHRLPFAFLLQGHFTNHMTLPPKPHEV